MELGLKGRVAIVAASSQGIGRATAEAFAAEGCRVAMCARNERTLARAAEDIRKQHSAEVLARALDVTDAAAVRQFVEAVVAKFGAADICVTNAGGPPAKGFLAATVEDWHKAVEANFMSTVHFAREVIPHMQRGRWGRIITITSITTKQPVADLVLSNAVRAAVVGLVKSLANEFGKDGILVNNVGPGFTATDRPGQRPAAPPWELSAGRAVSVREILAGSGVPDDRFASVAGKADTEPMFPDNPYMPANRRVTVTLLKEAPPVPNVKGLP